MGASHSSPTANSIHEFTVKDCSGKAVDLGLYKGKVLLVVNVASKCGLTDNNYTQLTELYNKYRNKGLIFLFNSILFLYVRVNGPDTAPVYNFLKANKGGFFGSRIKWNFTKFLIDRDGKVLHRYSPTTAPLSIERDIQKALGEI
ncbi:hypothetical protein KFK09_000350 [Dendrobium nobile]|uniref:Glutathione peroxidase n=1 Tax=Dendrobium nobile TaxID=94219 RepID=A0A8T3CBL1_DENNO|nr:hypothetical protein KFK09_000350 [Dendrobium nobile]